MRYREQIYQCGDYLEVDIFPTFHKKGKKTRRARYKPTGAMQARLNQKNAERYLTRLLNANFNDGDLEVTLTYDDNHLPEHYEDAVKDCNNFLRRVCRLRKRLNLGEMRRVTIPGGGRYHFHIIMSGGVPREQIEELWGKGYANTKRLVFGENGLAGLAVYISNQLTEEGLDQQDIFDAFIIDEETGEVFEREGHKGFRKKNERRFTCSQNIIRPVPESKEGRLSRKTVEDLSAFDFSKRVKLEKIYDGYSFVRLDPFYNAENGGWYIHVRMRKRR